MLISCQNCATSYQVDPSSLGPTGRSVRCARCQRVWFAANPEALADVAEAYRADVGALATPSPKPAAPEPPPRAQEIVVESPSIADPPIPDSAMAWDAPLMDQGSQTEPLVEARPAEEIAAQSQQPLAAVAAPALAPIEQAEPAKLPPAPPAGEDIETVALRRAKKEASRWRLRWPLAAWPTAIVALIVINAALIVRRADVVRWVPQTASLYAAIGLPVNLRGLDFADVTTKKEIRDGVQVLVVEGMIVSLASHEAEVPRLRFGVRNEAGREIYSWTALPDRKVLPAGETMTFRSLLATPPREGREVVVRFFTRRDLVADIE
jgi:predicted Zn finger-like uncharacterized protein